MASRPQRFFAGFIAVLFLVTSSALTVLVIYTMATEDKQPTDNSAAQQTNQKENKSMLQGTQLANFTPMASIPELKTEDTVPGTGVAVKAGDTVTVDYTGAVASTGKIFQSSKDSGQPVSFPLDQVIAGWSQGIPGMKEGGTRRLLIPAVLAYGSQSPQGSGIPPNADLVFDVTLRKIGK